MTREHPYAVLVLESKGIQGLVVLIRSDNQGVIVDCNIFLSFQYVDSESNLVDPISRGDLGPAELRSPYKISLPKKLTPFLVHA